MNAVPPPPLLRPRRPRRVTGLGLALAVAALLMAATLFMMVLPGYWLFVAGDWPLGRFMRPFHGDHWLPFAFQMQLLWPPALPLLVWALGRALPARRGLARTLLVLLLALWAVLLASGLHWLAQPAAG